ncbi:MAG: IPTL-CTERM sorting domain-containing protein [Thermodesulfobacteriota bacterium]
MYKRSALSILFIFLFLLSFNSNSQAQIFENGDFETGDLTGWTVATTPFGIFDVYSGSTIDLFPIMPPPQGIYAAGATQEDSDGGSVLYQDINVPSSGAKCTAIIYYESLGDWVVGSALDDFSVENVQARIDIMDPNAPVYSIGVGVLQNIFLTQPGDPQELGYTTIGFNLGAFAGSTVRFRVGVVNNLSFTTMGIDDIRCTTAIPTLSEWSLIALAAVLGVIGFIVIRRRAITA